VYSILSSLLECIKRSTFGGVLYYSGSPGDRTLESYDDKYVTLYTPRTRTSFLNRLEQLLDSAEGGGGGGRGDHEQQQQPSSSSAGGGAVTTTTTAADRERGMLPPPPKGGVATALVSSGGGGGRGGEQQQQDHQDAAAAAAAAAKKKKTPRPYYVVVIDDGADLYPATVKDTDNLVQRISVSARHIPLTLIQCAQRHTMLSAYARANSSHTLVFPNSGTGEDLVGVASMCGVPKKDLQSALSRCCSQKDFIWSDLRTRRLYRGFGEMVMG
jgi:hypothetical protein